MSSRDPLISIVIPTRERAEKLPYTLKTVLSQPGDDFDVLVSDNASEDETRTVVEGISDARLRYVNTGRRLSMCDNWEFALANVRGRYAMVIGDDDALAPDAIASLTELIETEPVGLYCWEAHIYQWPSESSPASLRHLTPETRTSRIELDELVRFSFRLGGLRYMRLPLLYHSLVEQSILESIRKQTGRIFHSTQPDVFLGFAMPAICSNAVRIGRALSIYGVSEKPTDSKAIERRQGTFAEKTLRFAGEYPDYRFHASLPPDLPFWVKMIPDAMLVARDFFPDYYRDKPFDYDAMWAFLWRYWRFESILRIALRYREIRTYHPFHPGRYLFLTLLHLLSERRIALRRLLGIDPSSHMRSPCADNIADFALAFLRSKPSH
jgi:glycosyltransferase involved in cell wall biosynthesis